MWPTREEPALFDEEPETPAADKRPSIWKREISFGRKKQTPESDDVVEDAVAEEPVTEDAVVEHEAPLAVEPVPAFEEIAPVVLPEPVAEQPADDWRAPGWQPVQTPAPRLEVAPEPEPAPEPVAAAPEPEPSFAPTFEPEPAFQPTFEPVAESVTEPAFEPEPTFEPEPAFQPTFEPVAESVPEPAVRARVRARRRAARLRAD